LGLKLIPRGLGGIIVLEKDEDNGCILAVAERYSEIPILDLLE
jgi:hypothetical protein